MGATGGGVNGKWGVCSVTSLQCDGLQSSGNSSELRAAGVARTLQTVTPFFTFTSLSLNQRDLKAFPARFLRVQDHGEFRADRQEGFLHPLGVTPVHSSTLAVRSKWTVRDGQCAGQVNSPNFAIHSFYILYRRTEFYYITIHQ